ncbi:hypothetical protein ABID26_007509, partial [Mesorhizobium shonense]
QSLTDSFTAVSSDGTASQLVTVTIHGTNDAPTVSAAVTSTASEVDPAYTIDLLDQASDVDQGAVLHIANLTAPLPAGLSLDADGHTLHIDPSAYNALADGQSAVLNLSYDVVDEHGAAVAQTATITIEGGAAGFSVQWISPRSGNWFDGSNWSTGGVPTAADTVLIDRPEDIAVTIAGVDGFAASLVSTEQLLISSGSLHVSGSAALASLDVSGGTTQLDGNTSAQSLSVNSGTVIFDAATTTGALSQSGGELNGSGLLTVSGAATLSGGTESGPGTTLAQGGAAFNGSFGLDGGRVLQLGGSSTATGYIYLDLNASDPNTGVSDAGSAALTISSGATFDDQSDGGLYIYANNWGPGDDG